MFPLKATQEKNRVSSEMNELRDHLDIKDRKISVLQRKVFYHWSKTFQVCFLQIENLEDLLKEKDNQVDIAKSRLQQVTRFKNHFTPTFDLWKWYFILLRFRPSLTQARELWLTWRTRSPTRTNRSTSWGSSETGRRRTVRKRRSCTRENWRSTKWKSILTTPR